MTTDQTSKKGSNLGCVLRIIGIIIGIEILLLLISTIKVWILADDYARALQVFHNDYILFQKYYLTLPFGAFGARALIGFVISFIATILIYGFSYFLPLGNTPEKKDEKRSNLSAKIFWILIISFILTCFFLPQQKVIVNPNERQLEITQFNSWYFFQSPFNARKSDIPFEEISSFHYDYYSDNIRGSTNYFLDLFCVSHSGDTVAIGHTMTHHGEFGFLDFKSQEERDAKALEQAESVVDALTKLTE